MNRRETPWMQLDNSPHLVTKTHGVGSDIVTSRRSSYELPLSMRLVYDDEKKVAAFEFRYAFEEEARKFKLDGGGAAITFGRHSARVQRVEVPVKPEHAETAEMLFKVAAPLAVRALEQFSKNPRRWQPQRDNLYLAEAAIQSRPRLSQMAFAAG